MPRRSIFTDRTREHTKESIGTIQKIVPEECRILLYVSETYHVIAGPEGLQFKVGDRIRYEACRTRTFGWLKGPAAEPA